MPTNEIVTADMIRESKEKLQAMYTELQWSMLDSTLILFFIELYELSMVILSDVGDRAHHRNISRISAQLANNLHTIRNEFTHYLYRIDNIRSFITNSLDSENLNCLTQMCDMCGLNGIDVVSCIYDLCSRKDSLNAKGCTPTLLKRKIMKELIGE